MIGHKRIPGREGGVEVVVEELSSNMVALGHEVAVYNRKSQKIAPIKSYKGVRLINIPTIEKKSTDAVVYAFFASLHALFGKYDVIHYHALGPSVFLILPHVLGIRTVVTVHGLNYKTPKWKGFGEKFILFGEKITARYSDEIIVLSKEQQKYFLEKFGRKTTYIPNGTASILPLASNEISKRYGLEKDSFVLFVSRLVPGKGLEHLIDAYKQTALQIPLIIAGDTAYVDDFFESVRKSAADDPRIHFIGFVTGTILHELYSNARLFVFPSEAEGMPMSLLEAMSFNARCLISDIPENIELGGRFVQSFKTADIVDLKEQLIKCISNDDTLFPSGCREYILKNYNWDNVVQKTLQCYRSDSCLSCQY